MDHELFNEEILDKATKAILKTRDGKLRAAVPHPLGSCVFLNDLTAEDMNAALRKHKEIMKQYPRNGEGIDAFVDASDTGYTVNDAPVEKVMNGKKANGVVNGQTNGHTNGKTNGLPAGMEEALANGYANGYKN